METLAKILRFPFKLRFKVLGLATIKDIPTEDFNRLIQWLIAAGWKLGGEYQGFDAWIDYGRLKLRRGLTKLTLEWDNWTEGSIEGPRKVVEAIAEQHNLKITHKWRWSEYDE